MTYQPIVAVGKDCDCGHPMIWTRGQQRCAVYGLHAAPVAWRNRDAPFSGLVDLCMEAPNNTRHAKAMRAKRARLRVVA